MEKLFAMKEDDIHVGKYVNNHEHKDHSKASVVKYKWAL